METSQLWAFDDCRATAVDLPKCEVTWSCRHLMIPLVTAERSWSRAMELKAQLEKEAVSYKRQHMVREA